MTDVSSSSFADPPSSSFKDFERVRPWEIACSKCSRRAIGASVLDYHQFPSGPVCIPCAQKIPRPYLEEHEYLEFDLGTEGGRIYAISASDISEYKKFRSSPPM